MSAPQGLGSSITESVVYEVCAKLRKQTLQLVQDALRTFSMLEGNPAEYWSRISPAVFNVESLAGALRNNSASPRPLDVVALELFSDTLGREIVRQIRADFLDQVLKCIDNRIMAYQEDESLSAETLQFVLERVFQFQALSESARGFDANRGTWNAWILTRVEWAISDWWKQFRARRVQKEVPLDNTWTPSVRDPESSARGNAAAWQVCLRLDAVLEKLSDPQRSCWTTQKCHSRSIKRKDLGAMSRYSTRELDNLKIDIAKLCTTLEHREQSIRIEQTRRLEYDIRLQAKITKLVFCQHKQTLIQRELQTMQVSRSTIEMIHDFAENILRKDILNNWSQLEIQLPTVDVQRAGKKLYDYALACSAVRIAETSVEAARQSAQKVAEEQAIQAFEPSSQEIADLLLKSISAVEAAIHKAKRAIIIGLKAAPLDPKLALGNEQSDE